MIETLEERAVPATIASAANVLTYAATVGVNNNLTVSISRDALFVLTDTGETITTGISGATGSGTNSVTIPTGAVSGISLQLGDGNDAIASGGVSLTTQALSISQTGSLLFINGGITTTSGSVTINHTGAAGSVLNIGRGPDDHGGGRHRNG